MKKTVAILLAMLMTVSALSVLTVNAQDAFSVDNNLILHWNFDGSTQEEQLANKASGGEEYYSLDFATQGNSKIEGGAATIGTEAGEQLIFNGDGTKGAILDECKTEYTFLMKAKIHYEGSWISGANYYLFWLNGPAQVRFAAQSWGTYATGPRVIGPMGDTTNTMTQRWSLDGYSYYAVTMKLNGNQLTTTVYCGDSFVPSTYTTTLSGGDLLNASSNIVLAAGKAPGGAALGRDATYDDIRVYNKALSEDQLKNVISRVDSEVRDVEPEAIMFEGVQFRNMSSDKFDIRFVAKIPKADYSELGFNYDMAKWTNEGADKKVAENINVKCDVAYRKLSYGDSYYNSGYGCYYLAVAITDIPLTAEIDNYSFEVTAYAKGKSTTYLSDTYGLTVTDGKSCDFTLLVDNGGLIMDEDKLPSGENDRLEGFVKYQSKNGTEAAPVLDVQGGYIQNIMNEAAAHKEMKGYADAGYTRVYITVPGDGLPVYSDTRCSANTTLVDRRYEENQAACNGNIMKLYNQVAHEYGLNMIAIYKPYEGGGGLTIPEGQKADNCDFYEDTIGGRRVYFDNFIKEHPEMRVSRRDDGYIVDMDKHITKLESVFVLDTIKDYLGNIYSTNYAGQYTAVTASEIGTPDIRLFTSTDNHTYQEYTGAKTVKWTQERRHVYDANGLLKMANANVYVMTVTGLDLSPDTYLAMVIPEGVNTKLRTIPFSNIKLFSGNEALTTSVTYYVRNVWGEGYGGSVPYEANNGQGILWGFEKEPTHTQGASLYSKWNDVRYERWEGHGNSISLFDRFTKYGFEFEYAGAGNGGEGWATGKVYGIAVGKPQYVAGMLCEAYEEVRQHWLDYTKFLLDECEFDGIEFRMLNHSTFITDPINYGYNQPIVDKYMELYGVDISDPDVEITEEMYINIMKIRGDFFMMFLEDVDAYTEATGKSFGMHLIDAYADTTKQNMDHTGMNSLISPYRPKILFDWKKCIDMCDEVSIKEYTFNTYDTQNCIEIKQYAYEQGKMCWVNVSRVMGEINVNYTTQVDNDPYVGGMMWYEYPGEAALTDVYNALDYKHRDVE